MSFTTESQLTGYFGGAGSSSLLVKILSGIGKDCASFK